MINTNERLTIYYDDSSTMEDISKKMSNYFSDEIFEKDILAADYIYVGFEKPINSVYFEQKNGAGTTELAVEYWNGSAYTNVVGLYDGSDGLTKSAFISWDRGQDDEVAVSYNSLTKFWYRLSVSDTVTGSDMVGLNILFSDDRDLKKEIYEISKFLPVGETTHVLSHVAARDEIIQDLNGNGMAKVDLTSKHLVDITSFDLLDVSQVKMASTYLALSKIFFAAMDDDDVYRVKSEAYRSLYNGVMGSLTIDIDFDDDGIKDSNESESLNYGFIKRL